MFFRFPIWAIKQVVEHAEAEYYSPEAIRRELSQWQYRLENKEITPEEYREYEKRLFERLIAGQERGIEE
ncbi:gas vesicle protein GvpG [Desulfosporosinus sp. OT]|uniref:gas vesicle protein GvpG n=1 Tax=Desulfosporosinus sp. OT TaxID=913865 RepID=UPI000223A697|nr:gas vesicle protein GvpG [Desulfosporosinus sp. OT]EGW36381.1 gas vesicle G domain protein [Desulfosporosinus sp. OT]